jgi:2-polyprenyl-3-methyl-5-hydroxy-6-metoxy-1,4-benzoquinol methylase
VLVEIKTCLVCSESNFTDFLKVKDHSISGEQFNISMCKNCGFRFTNPIPSEETIGKYYQSDDYISHSDTNKGIINKLYHIVRKQSLSSKLNLINKHSKTKGTLLDVGCGTGYFLQTCKENGWQITGMEPDDKARTIAEENTKQKIYNHLFSIEGEQKFDIITLWHVLEHVHQLNETIVHLRKLLKKEGILIIAVPNINSYDADIYKEYWAALDVPRHLYHFTERDITQLFSKHRIDKIGTYPMKFDSFYVSMLSEKYKNGSTNYFSAFINGLMSNIKAIGLKNHSSKIYVFQKND